MLMMMMKQSNIAQYIQSLSIMKSDKETLLKKNGKNQYAPLKEEWIEMEDLRAPEQEIAYKKLEETNPYPSLKQSGLKQQPAANSSQQQARSRPVPPPPRNQPQNVPQQPNIYPSQSISGSRPNTITLNGTTFKQKSAASEQVMKKTKIPLMEVACQFCTVMQKVPGNTQVYICGTCQNMNECYPLYGIFICGCCQRNVCYAFGTSQFIKCTRCGTINKVPFEPQKKYQAQKKDEKKTKPQEKKPEYNYARQEEKIMKEQPAKLEEEELILTELEGSEMKSDFTEKEFKYDDI